MMSDMSIPIGKPQKDTKMTRTVEKVAEMQARIRRLEEELAEAQTQLMELREGLRRERSDRLHNAV